MSVAHVSAVGAVASIEIGGHAESLPTALTTTSESRTKRKPTTCASRDAIHDAKCAGQAAQKIDEATTDLLAAGMNPCPSKNKGSELGGSMRRGACVA